jgi:bilirubin oxidase
MLFSMTVHCQNALFIPPSLSGTTFNLDVQTGTQNFYPGNPTPTYGINGPFLSPTIIVNKGDVVTLNVNNGLSVATTMHWHGLHVAPVNDGGPHQSIAAGTTWSPSFEILNNAGTFWYHPHGEGKTELHVGKGLAGMFIIHDAVEQSLGLPQTYGVDDIPLITQSKAFDVLQQIAIADHMDTSIMVNGTIDAFYDAPAQVIRFRLVNGSSMRSFNYGFSNGMTFYQIATDGGLVETPNALTRLLLAPGERSEILVDLTTMNGQSFELMSYGSEITNGIFGAPAVGTVPDVIEMYGDNPLNGADYGLLAINVVAPTGSPVTTIPTSLVPYTPYLAGNADVNRSLTIDTLRILPIDAPNLAAGPFGINGEFFDMMVNNIYVPLNSTEIWTLHNKTHIAHPFHIHDIQFNIIEKNGVPPVLSEQGWKDVVLVMPHDSVKFITKFITFEDNMVPYMYHCHLLHHEDDGMMGSFIVSSTIGINEISLSGNDELHVYPNPSTNNWEVKSTAIQGEFTFILMSLIGEKVFESKGQSSGTETHFSIPTNELTEGIYILKITSENKEFQTKLMKAN